MMVEESELLDAATDFLRAQRQVDMARKDGGPEQQRAYRFRNQAIKKLKSAVEQRTGKSQSKGVSMNEFAVQVTGSRLEHSDLWACTGCRVVYLGKRYAVSCKCPVKMMT